MTPTRNRVLIELDDDGDSAIPTTKAKAYPESLPADDSLDTLVEYEGVTISLLATVVYDNDSRRSRWKKDVRVRFEEDKIIRDDGLSHTSGAVIHVNDIGAIYLRIQPAGSAMVLFDFPHGDPKHIIFVIQSDQLPTALKAVNQNLKDVATPCAYINDIFDSVTANLRVMSTCRDSRFILLHNDTELRNPQRNPKLDKFMSSSRSQSPSSGSTLVETLEAPFVKPHSKPDVEKLSFELCQLVRTICELTGRRTMDVLAEVQKKTGAVDDTFEEIEDKISMIDRTIAREKAAVGLSD